MLRDKLYPVSAVLFYKRSLSIACNPFLNALRSQILISHKSDGAINNVVLSKKYYGTKLLRVEVDYLYELCVPKFRSFNEE